jgi:hypothetical protein
MHFAVSGVVSVVKGEGHLFLASGGSWSGGQNLEGAVVMAPGAVIRYGAKGSYSYLTCSEAGIAVSRHNPAIFEEGGVEWKPL